MKRIVTIENLYQRAIANSRQTGVGYAASMRRGYPVYEVVIDRNSNMAILRHYRTITVMYDMYNRELVGWYGEGVSDRDSMNTFLSCLQEGRYYFRYGKNMGFVMQDELEVIPVDPESSNIPLPVSTLQGGVLR